MSIQALANYKIPWVICGLQGCTQQCTDNPGDLETYPLHMTAMCPVSLIGPLPLGHLMNTLYCWYCLFEAIPASAWQAIPGKPLWWQGLNLVSHKQRKQLT